MPRPPRRTTRGGCKKAHATRPHNRSVRRPRNSFADTRHASGGNVGIPQHVLLALRCSLAIIGELCRFLEFDRMVMALSSKPVILAMPMQAWEAARRS